MSMQFFLAKAREIKEAAVGVGDATLRVELLNIAAKFERLAMKAGHPPASNDGGGVSAAMEAGS